MDTHVLYQEDKVSPSSMICFLTLKSPDGIWTQAESLKWDTAFILYKGLEAITRSHSRKPHYASKTCLTVEDRHLRIGLD